MSSAARHKLWADKNRAHLRAYQAAWRAKNAVRIAQYRQRSKAKNRYYDRGKARRQALLRKFGTTPERVAEMEREQRNRCAICRTDTPKGKGTWHVDHCHETKRVRGLLCQNCNIGLGNFKDNKRFLQSAINYLTKHKKQEIIEA